MTSAILVAPNSSVNGSGSPDSEKKLPVTANTSKKEQLEPTPGWSGTFRHQDYSLEIAIGLVAALGVSIIGGGVFLVNRRLRGHKK